MTPVRNYRARTKYSLMLQGIIPNSYVRPPLLEIPEYEKIIIKEILKSARLIK
jgi:dihydrodipicolinate synthase/N-acetylneuraminate lyase